MKTFRVHYITLSQPKAIDVEAETATAARRIAFDRLKAKFPGIQLTIRKVKLVRA
jgi:hypothetical protein